MKLKRFVVAATVLLSLTMLFFTACGGGDDVKEPEVVATDLQIRYDGGEDFYFVGDSVNADRVVITATLEGGGKKTFVAGKEPGCKIEPAVFSAGDDKVTITYGGVSASFDVTVIGSELSEVSVEFGQVPKSWPTGASIDLSGLKVTAKYGTEYSAVVDDFTIVDKDTGKEYAADNVTLDEGAHDNLCVRYKKKDSAVFSISVFNGYIVEAENVKLTSEVGADDKNYVELIKTTGSSSATMTGISPGPVQKATEPASGGAYLGEVKTGAVFAFHIWSDVEREADIILSAASGYLTEDNDGGWVPVVMGDMQFNRVFTVTYSNSSVESQAINIADDVILEGDSTDNPSGDSLLWVSWKDVTFGTVTLKPGDNVFTFTVISNYTNCHNNSCAANVDRMEVRFKD